MLTKDYVMWLIELNGKMLADDANTKQHLSTCMLGFIEELLEFRIALVEGTDTDITKEAGDVCAYATLVLLLSGDANVANVIACLEEGLTKAYRHEFDKVVQSLAGNFKRVSRGEVSVNTAYVVQALECVSYYSQDYATPSSILRVNIKKLIDRVNRGCFDRGSGDNR